MGFHHSATNEWAAAAHYAAAHYAADDAAAADGKDGRGDDRYRSGKSRHRADRRHADPKSFRKECAVCWPLRRTLSQAAPIRKKANPESSKLNLSLLY